MKKREFNNGKPSEEDWQDYIYNCPSERLSDFELDDCAKEELLRILFEKADEVQAVCDRIVKGQPERDRQNAKTRAQLKKNKEELFKMLEEKDEKD